MHLTIPLVPLLVAAATFQPTVSRQFVTPAGQTQLETGVLSAPLDGKLTDAVSAYAHSRRDDLGLPSTSTLSAPQAFGTRFGASFHLEQLVNGVPVYGAIVIVTVDAQRHVVQVGSSAVRYERARTRFNLTMDDAAEVASKAIAYSLRNKAGKPYAGVKRMMFKVGDEVHAGYLVWVPTLDQRSNWFVGIDAVNGQVLWTQDRTFHAANDAEVYLNTPGGANGGVGVTATHPVTLSHFGPEHETGGYLFGDQIESFNCCVNEGCSTAPGAKPKRAQGMLNVPGLGVPINYDVAVCDRMPRATNDPMKHASGDFVYTPVDPPAMSMYASQSEPADTDEFSEVHAFYHVNNVYDFVRGLSETAGGNPVFADEGIPPFQTRDETAGKKLAVWSNALFPDFQTAQSTILTGTAKADNLIRFDNAAYMPKETFDQLMIPELAFDTDALAIFQGNTADFGYDAPVYWHEFGHGVIYATAAFNSFTLDERSGNNEGAALHEGIADFIAAAFGKTPVIGEYVGPRLASLMPGTENGLRNLENSFACPDVLWGEPHQDSQHFSAALWEARKELFQGQDQGSTFDAALYAALVSMTPETDFAQAAAAVANHVKLAFPEVTEADQKIQAIFEARGVTNCSKIVDLTGSTEARKYYGIGGPQQAGLAQGQLVPGPYQMMIHLPEGAKSVSVSATPAQSQNPFGGAPNVHLLVKAGQPITFTRDDAKLLNDADQDQRLGGNGTLSATANVDVDCGGDVYLTLASGSPTGDVLQNLSVTFEESGSCAMEMPDAGTPGDMMDAGQVIEPAAPPKTGQQVKPGCGCNAVDPSLAAFGLLSLLAFARRRRG